MEVEVVEQSAPLVKTGRDGKGRFADGNKLRPPGSTNGGRPRKLDSRPILEAIHDTFDPAEIGRMLMQARDIAIKNEEWKGLLEIARFVASYAIGKPVQRSVNATISAEDFANIFKMGGDHQHEDMHQHDTIDQVDDE